MGQNPQNGPLRELAPRAGNKSRKDCHEKSRREALTQKDNDETFSMLLKYLLFQFAADTESNNRQGKKAYRLKPLYVLGSDVMKPGAAHKNSQKPYNDITDNLGDSKTSEDPPPDRTKDDCHSN
jgi:hypothetical protein